MEWSRFNPFTAADRQQNQPPATKIDPNSGVITTGKSDLDPNASKDPNKGGQGDDPLLNFTSLWEPNKDKDGKPIENKKNTGPYIPNIDPKKLDEMMSKTNFLGGISQEEAAAIAEGGEKAAGAFATMIQRATANAFKTALAASTRLAEQGLSNARERFSEDVPGLTRDLMVDSDLSNDPILKNPALQPIVKMVKDQYLNKFPKASPAELNNAVRQYFAYLGGEISKPKDGEKSQDNNDKKLRQGAPDADFMEWLGEDVKNLGGSGFGGDTSKQVQSGPQE